MPLKTAARIATIIQASAQPNTFDIFNLDLYLENTSSSLQGVVYHKATSNVTIKKADIQIFDKNGIESGILSVDIKKGSTPSNSSMVSIFNELPSIDFSQAVDYENHSGILDQGEITLNEGDMLRIDVNSTLNKKVNFRLILTGER